uniref:RRM domain-containing protein n=1 Tax=Salix viminalis TaxID=40686 RepID=A0A6N2M0H7_SALVM
MEFDEYDYLEKTVENSEPPKAKETANGGDDKVKSREKDRSRSSKHRSDEKDLGNDDERSRSKRSRSGDESKDREQSKERSSSRRRSQSRDGERDRHKSSREHRDRDKGRDRDREERNGKERDHDRDRRERDHDSEKEREKERSRRSRSRSERHRSEQDEKDRERSRDRELREKEKEREREPRERDRESRRYKERKEGVEPEVDPERDQRTVFAYQISLKADERDVYEFFSRAGKVRDVRLIMDRNSRRSKGVGYIEFYDAMSVPMAIALSGQLLLGQPVMVKPSEAEKNLVQSTTAVTSGGLTGPYSGGARRLYVGNLHFNITEDQLRQVFEPFGTVELVQLPHDESGHCKGFGFVQFARLEDARNALNLNGQVEIAGRPIKVSAVTDQTGAQDGTNVGDFDDDEGGGLALNARSRAILMQKLDRTGTASSFAGSLGTPTLPPAPALGATPIVSPAIAPLLSGSVPAIPGLPVAGLQFPATAIPTVDTIGVPSDCLFLKNMFDPKTETEPDFDLDIKEDVQEECSRFGNVKHIYIDKNSAGFVYMRFENTQAAINAQRSLHGRWFAGKLITATFMQTGVNDFGCCADSPPRLLILTLSCCTVVLSASLL